MDTSCPPEWNSSYFRLSASAICVGTILLTSPPKAAISFTVEDDKKNVLQQ